MATGRPQPESAGPAPRGADPAGGATANGSGQDAPARSEAPSARIHLCGPLRVEVAGRRVEQALPGRQGRLLFAFLALSRRPVTRDELIDVLWPHDPPASPEAGLSTLLARLRRVLGEGVIAGREQLSLALGDDAFVDVEAAAEGADEAERALSTGDARAALAAAEDALAVVRQPLLPGVEAPWLEERRRELAELEPRLLEAVVRAGLALGGPQLAAAERAARALVEREPYRESGYALLMEAYARQGNVAEALRVFDRLRRLLVEELGAVPSPSVAALHERLLRERELEAQGASPEAAAAPAGAATAGAPAPTSAPVPAPASAPAEQLPLPAIGAAREHEPFVGRASHLDRLHERWRECASGMSRLVLVAGEPGVGKTRLAARFAADVHAGGGAVLYGRCDEEPLVPYQPFVEALRHYIAHAPAAALEALAPELRELGRLVPELRRRAGAPPEESPSDADARRYRLFEAARAVLGQATRPRPLLLVLDDLHWADKPTLLVLRHLLRHHQPGRLMVLGLFRDVDVDWAHPLVDVLADLRREAQLDRLALEGLDDEEAEALVAARLEGPATAAFVRRLRAQTEGNPFFIEEALRSLVESRGAGDGAAAAEGALEGMGVPEGVKEIILRRVARLSPSATRALAAASAIGRDFGLGLLEELVEPSGEPLLAALEEAIGAGLVAERPERVDVFSFSHALVRDTIYEHQTASRRTRLHLRAAEALEARAEREEANPAELAHHFLLARDLAGPEKAFRYTLAAAERAAESLAYEEAADHYRRALEALGHGEPGDDGRRCDVLLALGRVRWQAGDPRAREAFRDAAASARRRRDPERLARAALGIGERYWETAPGDLQYRRLLEEALGALGDEEDGLRARVMARLAEHLHFGGEEERAVALSGEAVERARRAGNRDALATALLGRHVALLHVEHLEERLALIDEVLTLSAGHRELAAEARHWRLYDLYELGDLEAAGDEQAELGDLARQLRQPLFDHLALAWQAVGAQVAGDLERAEGLAQEAFALGRRARVRDAPSVLAAMLFLTRREQGRVAELLPMIESSIRDQSAPRAWRAAEALAHLELGEEARARSEFERLADRGFADVPQGFFWLSTVATLAETCAALGDAARAPALYAFLRPHAPRYVQVSFAGWWGPVEYFLGLLAATMDRHDAAAGHFEAALESSGSRSAPLLVARAEVEYARLLLRRPGGDRGRAGGLLAEALDTAGELGLERLAQRATALAS